MFFSGISFPFLNGVADILAPTFLGMGAFVLTLITITQYQQVSKTKNTVFLNKQFMIYQIYACFFLGSASLYAFFGGFFQPWGTIDIIFVFINVCLLYTNYYTLKIKLTNMDAAKKAGMSELEHYEKVIAPALKFKTS